MELCDDKHEAIVHDESECPLCKALGEGLPIEDAKDATAELVRLMKQINKIAFPSPARPDSTFFELPSAAAPDSEDALIRQLTHLERDVAALRQKIVDRSPDEVVLGSMTPTEFLVDVRKLVSAIDKQVDVLKELNWESN